MAETSLSSPRARTKIVATVGPASSSLEQLGQLVEAGVDVFRINMAHGSRQEHETVVERIRETGSARNQALGILVDLAGPKIRLGQLASDPLICPQGSLFRIVRGDVAQQQDELVSNYPQLIDELEVGDRVMLADGTVGMKVVKCDADVVSVEVIDHGQVRSRQGLNLPGVTLSIPSLTEQDRDNAAWAATAGVEFIGLSFVRGADEIYDLKGIISAHESRAMVVAKIEKREALENLDEIVLAADAVMVARGDLGVEIDFAETPMAQKRIINTCQHYSRPVIVATQMLDSMHDSPRPTRAEVTDVANAVLDGTDACMLSGETAIGNFPIESVLVMNRIMLNTEKSLPSQPAREAPRFSDGVHPITAAVVYGAARIAARLDASFVVVATRSGNTARVKAKQRDFIPTVGISSSAATLNQLCLYWGIIPVPGLLHDSQDQVRDAVIAWGRQDGCLANGDRIVLVTGTGLAPLAHNMVHVHEVSE
jgi:pyruvate kinase